MKESNTLACDYEVFTNRSLAEHKRSVHEGVKYPCKQCDYDATKKRNLAEHQRVLHNGVK